MIYILTGINTFVLCCLKKGELRAPAYRLVDSYATQMQRSPQDKHGDLHEHGCQRNSADCSQAAGETMSKAEDRRAHPVSLRPRPPEQFVRARP